MRMRKRRTTLLSGRVAVRVQKSEFLKENVLSTSSGDIKAAAREPAGATHIKEFPCFRDP